MLFSYLHPTLFGPIVIIWSYYKGSPKVVHILLSSPKVSARKKILKLFPDAKSSSHKNIKILAKKIDRFLKGGKIRFSLKDIRLDLCSPFQQKVLRVEYKTPRGKVTTYGAIAKKIKNPKAVRAVGMALAKNPFPVIIPCHRTICSDGMFGGYQGGPGMKRALIKKERVKK